MNSPLFFFTAEDPRDIPKGSRDPLRFLPIWSKVARQMIPYLTTVTPSYRGFLTRFLFHAAIEEISPQLAQGSKNEQWEAFNKFEQFCGIVRSQSKIQTNIDNFPGKSNISNRNKQGRAVVGSALEHWLMRSQKNTGFWGYYHQASLGCGLLKHNSHADAGYMLTDEAKAALLNYLPVIELLSNNKLFLKKLFSKKKLEFEINEFEDFSELFAQNPASSGDVEWFSFWKKHLLSPIDTSNKSYRKSIQNGFAELVANTLQKDPKASESVIWESLAQEDSPESVVSHAQAIKSTEAVIGLCEWTFDACRLRAQHGENISSANAWAIENGYDEIWLNKLRQIAEPIDPELRTYRDIALSNNHSFKKLAKVLIERHKIIMLQRKGAPWVELLEDESLLVRERSIEPRTPELEAVSSGIKWRYGYFLGSWVSIARELGFLQDSGGNN